MDIQGSLDLRQNDGLRLTQVSHEEDMGLL